jgi:iron-sulfur cluster assembly accessory protein
VQELTFQTTTDVVTITSAAAEKVKSLAEREGKAGYALRLLVRGGGCAGFSYGLTFDNNKRPEDHVVERDGVQVYVDSGSAPYLEGSEIDFQDGLQGSGFVINNPNATGGCGCGHSFSAQARGSH